MNFSFFSEISKFNFTVCNYLNTKAISFIYNAEDFWRQAMEQQ